MSQKDTRGCQVGLLPPSSPLVPGWDEEAAFALVDHLVTTPTPTPFTNTTTLTLSYLIWLQPTTFLPSRQVLGIRCILTILCCQPEGTRFKEAPDP